MTRLLGPSGPLVTPSRTPGPRLAARLTGLPRYRPGSAALVGAPADVARLASNESPFPPLRGVEEAVARAVRDSARYADLHAAPVAHALASRFGVSAEQVVVGTGSSALLLQLALATSGPGDEVVHAWRSFESYPIVAGIAGARAVGVPLTVDARHDLAAMADAVTPRTRLVLLCSPNNPTGTVLGEAELRAFLRRVPPDVVVALDEAYAEFVRDPDAADGAALLADHPHLVVLRTFSKAHGLAALRVGYAIAHPDVAEALRAVAVPFGVSGPAQAAALASLAAAEALAERVDRVVAERRRLAAGLTAAGLPVVEGHGNFVWVPARSGTAALAARFAAAGVAVRPFVEGSDGDGVRITVGTPGDTDRVLTAVSGRGGRGGAGGSRPVGQAGGR